MFAMDDTPIDDDFEDDEDEFDHFTDAQDSVWDTVMSDLAAGRATGNWVWFVFPVLTGIDDAPMAMFYSLRDAAEASEFARHPVLGPRLVTCLRKLTENDRPLSDTMADENAYKVRACATLFETAVPQDPIYAKALDDLFGGQRCTKTQRQLREPPPALF
ncbi:Uncharacterized protein, DUF1810 family [Loktanella sp. DSM 29012]|uniref:DUF1810 family protein n=1 Tax=Loktanella sp. DSM 29012 TaxID=1881056 RepID=UPI0008D1229F|nr:DUF1810 family protein [Loktanella sp. DSM 29012]SEP57499.1 Uncharacterized protein, DUF1810 family [Loktanella sp. DSM 29012]